MKQADKQSYYEQIFRYLDDLRESGEINMFGASPYVAAQFGISNRAAAKAWAAWSESFDGKSSVEERARKAVA